MAGRRVIGTLLLAALAGTASARDPGPGFGAPGPGVRDPGINQPGAAGNVGGVARRSVRR